MKSKNVLTKSSHALATWYVELAPSFVARPSPRAQLCVHTRKIANVILVIPTKLDGRSFAIGELKFLLVKTQILEHSLQIQCKNGGELKGTLTKNLGKGGEI